MSIYVHPPEQPLSYQVEIRSFDRMAEIPENVLRYKSVIAFKKITFNGCVLNIKRSEISLNNQIDQDPYIEILLITAKVLDDLDIEVSLFGNILRILNMKAIRNQWKEICYRIEHTYTGDFVESLMQGMSQIVADDDLFIQSLYRDAFLGYYFQLIFGEYGRNGIMSKEIPIYGFFDHSPVKVHMQAVFKEEKETIAVKMNLSESDEQLLCAEMEKKFVEKGNLQTEMNAIFTIFAEQGYINSIHLILSAEWNGQTVKKMQVEVEKLNL